MKKFSEQLDDRYYGILEHEYNLAFDLARYSDDDEMANSLESFLRALTQMPPDWSEAEKRGCEVAALGCADRYLEPLRNAIIRALSPLLDDLPETFAELLLAKNQPISKPASAVAAARIIRIFGNEFDPH